MEINYLFTFLKSVNNRSLQKKEWRSNKCSKALEETFTTSDFLNLSKDVCLFSWRIIIGTEAKIKTICVVTSPKPVCEKVLKEPDKNTCLFDFSFLTNDE